MHPVFSLQENAENAPSATDPALDMAYPVTYYKDATAPDDASPIPIRGGDHLEVDLRLNPVPALRLLFHPPDNGEHGFTSPVLRAPAFDGMEQVPYGGGMQMVSPGVYAMTGVPAGRYTVRTYGSPAEGSPTNDIEMDITQDGQELDPSKGEPTSTVKASVQLAETLPKPLVIALRNSKMRVVASNQVSDKGEAEFQNVPPGKYEVLAQGPGKAYAVVRIATEGGKDVSGNILNVTAGSSLTVSLAIVGSSVKVEGFVKRNGQPVAGAMVVLVPKNPESNHRQFRRDQSDQDGSFALPGVIPGAYTVVAIEDGWDLDWSSPGVIAHYCQHGQPMTVEGLNKTSVRLPDPIELQPK
jgi:sarcosine oxidase gamma subunit